MLGSDKLQCFSDMLGLQHLDVPHLRGRTGPGITTKKENEIGGAVEKKGVESSEEVGTSDTVGTTSGNSGRVKKDRANWKMEAKTRTCFDVVKGLKIEDELETANSDKRGNESEATKSVE